MLELTSVPDCGKTLAHINRTYLMAAREALQINKDYGTLVFRLTPEVVEWLMAATVMDIENVVASGVCVVSVALPAEVMRTAVASIGNAVDEARLPEIRQVQRIHTSLSAVTGARRRKTCET
jgi:hypothetical protein